MTTPTAASELPPEALASTYELSMASLGRPMDWNALYGRVAPRLLEVGCGSGHWTSEYARAHPELDLFGVEVVTTEVRRALDKVRRRGLTNVRLLRCDVLYFLREFVAAESFDAIHVYCPDPWPKKRHAKRRVFRPDIVGEFLRTLKPNHLLIVKTDITAYYDQIREVVCGAGEDSAGADAGAGAGPGTWRFRLEVDRRLDLEIPRDEAGKFVRSEVLREQGAPEELGFSTNYERKALEAGRPVHFMKFRKETR